jgi:hypothetical protein
MYQEDCDHIEDWEIDAMMPTEKIDGTLQLFGALKHCIEFRDAFIAKINMNASNGEMKRFVEKTIEICSSNKDMDEQLRLDLLTVGAIYCNSAKITPEELGQELVVLKEQHMRKLQQLKEKRAKEQATAAESAKKQDMAYIEKWFFDNLPNGAAEHFWDRENTLQESTNAEIREKKDKLIEMARKVEIAARVGKNGKQDNRPKQLLQRKYGGIFTGYHVCLVAKLEGISVKQLVENMISSDVSESNNESSTSSSKESKEKPEMAKSSKKGDGQNGGSSRWRN